MLKNLKLKLFAFLGLALGGGKLMAIAQPLMQQMDVAVESICAKVQRLEEENHQLRELNYLIKQECVLKLFQGEGKAQEGLDARNKAFEAESTLLKEMNAFVLKQVADLEKQVAEYKQRYDELRKSLAQPVVCANGSTIPEELSKQRNLLNQAEQLMASMPGQGNQALPGQVELEKLQAQLQQQMAINKRLTARLEEELRFRQEAEARLSANTGSAIPQLGSLDIQVRETALREALRQNEELTAEITTLNKELNQLRAVK